MAPQNNDPPFSGVQNILNVLLAPDFNWLEIKLVL
jgi:hypothetical protein